MDYNSTYEDEIDLKALMFAVFHKWRPIILAAVVLGLLFGGFKAVSVYKDKKDPEAIEAADKKYREDMDVYEKNKASYEREIENLKTDISNQEEYLEKSIWINMSPYDVCEARADLYVSTDYEIMPGMVYQNVDYTDTILQAYQAVLSSSAVMERIAKDVGTESRYLKELVSVTTGTVSGRLNRMLTINVKHTSKENAKKVLDELLDCVYDTQPKIKAGIGEHTISSVNNGISSMVNLELADTQRSERQRLTTLNESLADKQKQLEDLIVPKKEDSTKKATIKSGVKYGVIGGVLGAFMVAFFVCVVFVMSDKVYSAKELKCRYRVKILGAMPKKTAKKVCRIDAWLNKLEGRACGTDEKVEYGLIAANIRNYAAGMNTLLLTGAAGDEIVKEAAAKLEAELPEFKVICGGSMLRYADTLGKLPECDGVVLIEQCSDSGYSEVELEIEKIRDLKKDVIGCVVFE